MSAVPRLATTRQSARRVRRKRGVADANRAIVEFEFDEAGQAVSFTVRSPDDEIEGTGVRAGG